MLAHAGHIVLYPPGTHTMSLRLRRFAPFRSLPLRQRNFRGQALVELGPALSRKTMPAFRRRDATASRLSRNRRTARSRGQALVEFALVVPVFLLFLVIAIDFGRLFYTYIGVNNAVREGAAFGSTTPTCASSSDCADPVNITYYARQEIGGGTSLVVAAPVCRNASGTVISCSSAPGGAGAGNRITVSGSESFTFLTPFISAFLGGSITIGASATAVVL